MSDNAKNPTENTREKVDRWIRAKKQVEDAQNRLALANSELTTSINDLGAYLVPPGMEYDEPFNIWFGTGILQATMVNAGKYEVMWRKEPDGKDRIEYGV